MVQLSYSLLNEVMTDRKMHNYVYTCTTEHSLVLVVLALGSFARNTVGGWYHKQAGEGLGRREAAEEIREGHQAKGSETTQVAYNTTALLPTFAAGNRSTFELSRKLRIVTDSQAQTPNFDGHADEHREASRVCARVNTLFTDSHGK